MKAVHGIVGMRQAGNGLAARVCLFLSNFGAQIQRQRAVSSGVGYVGFLQTSSDLHMIIGSQSMRVSFMIMFGVLGYLQIWSLSCAFICDRLLMFSEKNYFGFIYFEASSQNESQQCDHLWHICGSSLVAVKIVGDGCILSINLSLESTPTITAVNSIILAPITTNNRTKERAGADNIIINTIE